MWCCGYKPSYGLISRNGVLKTSYSLDHIGVFGKTGEDVALLAKVLIKKDSYDQATVYYSTEEMLNICRKEPFLNQNLFFIKQIHGN
ncbi:MAG: hypothetical protein CM1200mP13_09540 [Candidatus Pelagibacterales bacterium]|nr:MAG: hypothetical protein CM1200mP13_09540 [Pelagibacterales bacterium]